MVSQNGQDDPRRSKKAELARTLAWLMTEPDEEMVESLRNGAVFRLLSEYFSRDPEGASLLKAFSSSEDPGALLREMKEEYHRLFEDPGTKEWWWVESVHKPWTRDPGCRLSFAREKGYVMGDAALHMLYLYHAFGLEVPERFSAVPDHIVLELDFLGYLIERGPEGAVETFLRDHLDWIPEMTQRAAEYHPSPFYRSVLKGIEMFVAREKRELPKEAENHV